MRKINYNLAATRKIDVRAFALNLSILFLAVFMFNAITIFNLARQQRQSHAEKKEIRFIVQELEVMNQKALQQQKQINAWKKAWTPKLAFANFLIGR
jgi:hypothetical protein